MRSANVIIISIEDKFVKNMIIFLRHGQAENNTKKILAGRTPGINLTEEGKKQAEQAGEMIKSLNILQFILVQLIGQCKLQKLLENIAM